MYYLPFKLLYLNFILGVYLVCCENLGWNEGGGYDLIILQCYPKELRFNYPDL